MKKFTLFLASALFASTSLFAETKELVIGEGELPSKLTTWMDPVQNYCLNVPLNFRNSFHSQTVFTSSQLAEMAGKKITKVSFYCSANYAAVNPTVTIGLGTTTATDVTTEFLGGATELCSVSRDVKTSEWNQYEWIDYDFTSAYEYDGSNLVLDINNTAANGGYPDYVFFAKSEGTANWIYSLGGGAVKSTTEAPFVKFTYEDEGSVAPTPDPVFTFGGVLGADGAYTLDLGNVDLNSTASGVFTITGTDVTGDVTLSSTTLNLAKTTFTAEEIMAGVEVSFTRDITDLITVSDVITVTNGDATVGTVTVSWTPVDNTPVTPEDDYSRFDLENDHTFTIGDTSNSAYASSWHPICTKKASSGMERVYKKSEVGNPIDDLKINGVRLYLSGTNAGSFPVKIWLANTEEDPAPASMVKFAPESVYTKVFDESVSLGSETIDFTFIKPFVYDHTQNLRMLIEVDGASGVTFVADQATKATFIQYYSDAAGANAFGAPVAPSAMDEYNADGYTLRCNKTNNLKTTWLYNEVKAEAPVEGPSVTVDPATWEVGNVYAYADNSKVFTLKGKDITSDINITFSKDTSGETEWDTAYEFHFNEFWPYEESMTVTAEEANAEGGIEFKPFFTTYKLGAYTAEITISSSTGEFEDVVIPVSWTAINKPYINTDPSWYEDLGTVAKGATVEKEIGVYFGNLTEDITITAPEGITLDKTVISKDSDNPAYVKATFNTAEYGDHSGTVVFSTNDGDVTAELGLVWEVTDPEFSVDNTELDFGKAKTNEALSKTITLTAKAVAGDVTVSSPASDAVKVSASTIYKSDADGYELKVTLLPTELETNSDSFTLTAEGFDPITVNVKWTPVQGDIVNIVGSYTTDTQYYPFWAQRNASQSETIYSKEDLAAESDLLNGIAFAYAENIWSSGSYACDVQVQVWVGLTDETEVTNTEFTDVTTLTQVYNGPLSFEKGGDLDMAGCKWAKVSFNQDFKLEPGKNLRVIVKSVGDDYPNCLFLVDESKKQNYLTTGAYSEAELETSDRILREEQPFAVTKFLYTPKATEPVLEVSEDTWSIGDIEVGQSAEKTFTITGTDLYDDIVISHSCDAVTVSTELIGADEATEGYEIKVTVTPTNTDDFEDEILISSGNFFKTISIDWNATEPVSGIEAISFAEPTAVVVYDINGRCIKNEVVEGSMKETLSTLNSGIYVIKANKKAYKVQVK